MWQEGGWKAGRENSFRRLSPGGGNKARTVARGVHKFTGWFCMCPSLVCGLAGRIAQLESSGLASLRRQEGL